MLVIIILCSIFAVNCHSIVNYTMIQERVIGKWEDLIRVYGRIQGNHDKSGGGFWNYPSSSTQDLMRLYEEEKKLTDHLRSFLREIENQWKKHKFWILQRASISLRSSLQNIKLPRVKDFIIGSGLGLVQIQDVYKVNITKMLQGNIHGNQSPHRLSHEDCVFISRSARSLGRLDVEIDWLENCIGNESSSSSNG